MTKSVPGGRTAVTSGAAALAVVLVTVLTWWLLSGNGPEGPGGNGDRLGGTDGDAVAPTPATPAPSADEPREELPDVGIDSYVLEASDLLALNFTTGVPACDGRPAEPEVLQDEDGVTVTLRMVPPRKPADVCIELAVMRTVRVPLTAPLGGRPVLDGSTEPPAPVEEVERPYR